MSEAAENILTLEQITQIISQAKSAGTNPAVIGMQIFRSLGDNVTLPGNTLTLALTQSRIPIPGPLAPLVNVIQSVSKTRDHVLVVLGRQIETDLSEARIRFDEAVSFDVNATGATPALNNISGVSTHVVLAWPNITSIQLNQNQGHLTVAVTVGGFTKHFPID